MESVWSGFGRQGLDAELSRSLEETLNPFGEVGFLIRRLVEPRPTPEFRAPDPKHYEELMQQPCFLCIHAIRSEAPAEATPSPS